MAWPNLYGLDVRQFDPDNSKSANPPTLVLVHDAFHTAQHLGPLASELRNAGWRVMLPQMPSSSMRIQANAFEVDVEALCLQIKPEVNESRDVVLVLHGYAGLPGSVAAERLNQYAITRPQTGYVVKIIFVAGFVALESESYLDIYRPDWLIHDNGSLSVHNANNVFYQDCSAAAARAAMSAIQPQSAESLQTRFSSPGWKHIPCVYVFCELDNAFPADWQRLCARKLHTSNRQTSVLSIRSGHSPFLSMTREIGALIIQAVYSP